MSLIIRYTVSAVYYEPYIYGSHPDKPVWFRSYGQGYLCKVVLSLMMYGYVAPIFWMFVEGVYLHSRVATNVLDSHTSNFKLYYTIGWCKLSLLPNIYFTFFPRIKEQKNLFSAAGCDSTFLGWSQDST